VLLRRTALIFVLVVLVTVVARSSAPSENTRARELTTPERLQANTWWPTKRSTAADKYTGSAVCAECHAQISKSQPQSEMARTLMPAKNAMVAQSAGQTIHVDGFTYKLADSGAVTSTLQTPPSDSVPLQWAFGSGFISQAYLTEEPGYYLETHFRYFGEIHGFDVTLAQPRTTGDAGTPTAEADTANRGMGRKVQLTEVRRCFSCHSANVPAEGPITGVIPGVTCETCHGPGANHVAAERAQLPGANALIMNPAHLQPVDQVDFCGACHSTTMDVYDLGFAGPPSVRFPVYRLQNSKCWRNDARIQCTGCHNPHAPLMRETAAYDKNCLACHQSKADMHAADHPGPACPTGKSDCASCHMPKYKFPGEHYDFTDHDIRIVKAGEPTPP
jgi:Cytochrome c554 and c-prime